MGVWETKPSDKQHLFLKLGLFQHFLYSLSKYVLNNFINQIWFGYLEDLNLIKFYWALIQGPGFVLFLILQVHLWLHLLHFSVLWQWKSCFHPRPSIIWVGNSRISRKSITDHYLSNVRTVRGTKRDGSQREKNEDFLECNSLPLKWSRSKDYLKPTHKGFYSPHYFHWNLLAKPNQPFASLRKGLRGKNQIIGRSYC